MAALLARWFNAECRVENNYFENVQNPWELLTTTGTPNGKLYAAGNNVSYLDTSNGVRWVSGWYVAPGQTQLLIDGTDSVFVPPYSYTPDDAFNVKDAVFARAGNRGIVDGVLASTNFTPNFALFQNYPNPFNSSTRIRWSAQVQGRFSLTAYDMLGRRTTVLFEGTVGPGSYQTAFDGSNLPSSTYFITLRSDHSTLVKKAVLLK